MSEVRVTDRLDSKAIDRLPADSAPLAAAASPTPGFVLRRAREARGQSIDDVVQVIRFSARQIEALERDDYAALPGSTAVRGLVRNYAKFLKLDAAPLLAQLEPAVPVPAAEVRPPANMGEAEQPTIVERVSPRFVVAGVVAVLLALAGYWYSTLPEEMSLKPLLAGLMSKADPEAPNPVASPAAAAAAVAAPAPMVLANKEPVSVEATSSPAPAAGLRLEFDDRSWVEIRDATQKVLFSGEYPAGTRQNVEGKAPFQVWIGKASKVRLFMGERSIDLKPYTREDVARLNLE